MTSHNDILNFWFDECEPSDWWKKDTDFDEKIRSRFYAVYLKAIHGELFVWRERPEGRLAEIIIIDQFSRNLFREQKEAFAYDAMALTLSQECIRQSLDQSFSPEYKSFLYMPFMHSESKIIHEIAIQLFSQPGLEMNLSFEMKHKKIIDQFGRYPHRNTILGRTSTDEEIAFLQKPDSSF